MYVETGRNANTGATLTIANAAATSPARTWQVRLRLRVRFYDTHPNSNKRETLYRVFAMVQAALFPGFEN